MRWDAATDRYLAVSWEDAFREIGAELKSLDPDEAVFYTSGRASLGHKLINGIPLRCEL
jgi:anaerobic selenocysteine-containing dehydrogenase